MNNDVWVVYGRNLAARALFFSLLRSVGIRPLDFEQAEELTAQTSPYIGDVLNSAFNHAQAVVVLLTDDEQVELRSEFRRPTDEANPEFQARPNVIFEAGMALGLQPDRTIVVEIGTVRAFSDIVGRHVVKWSTGDVKTRSAFLRKLKAANLDIDQSSDDWMTVGTDIDLHTANQTAATPRERLSAHSGSTTHDGLDLNKDQTQSLSNQSTIGRIADEFDLFIRRLRTESTSERAANPLKIDGMKSILQQGIQDLMTLRVSPDIDARTSLYQPLDAVLADLKKRARTPVWMHEFHYREFWWLCDETIERLEAISRAMQAMVRFGVDPIDGAAMARLLADKACVRLAVGGRRGFGSTTMADLVKVEVPLRNEGRYRAYDLTLSIASELDDTKPRPEGGIRILEPGGGDSLHFIFARPPRSDPPKSEDRRYRMRIGFHDGLGDDLFGFTVRFWGVLGQDFRGEAVPERTIVSPLCSHLLSDSDS